MHPEALTEKGKKISTNPGSFEGLAMLSVPELAVTKAYTIGRRGSFKDYIDLYFAIQDRKVALAEIIELAVKKYGAVFNSRLFLEQLVYLQDIADVEVVFLREKVNREQLDKFFAAEIKALKL